MTRLKLKTTTFAAFTSTFLLIGNVLSMGSAFLFHRPYAHFFPRFGLVSSTTKSTSLKIHIEKRIEDLGITLPPASKPKANYGICSYTPGPNHDKEIMFLSGHLPMLNDGSILTGFVGPESGGKTVEEGREAARQTALNMVSTLENQLGDLDRVEQIVKIFGIVNSHTDFKQQHIVMDGFSDAMVEIFGKKIGYHARSAIGSNTLPLDITIEVEAIIRIKPK